MAAEERDHEHEHDDDEHEHGVIHFQRSDVDDATLTLIAGLHRALADELILSRRFEKLSDAEKRDLAAKQDEVESFVAWSPGYYAPGDLCAVCESPVSPIFRDLFAEGKLEYGVFVDDVPVHLRKECLAGFHAKVPRRAPQVMDKLRRATMREGARPSARLTQFFRRDVISQPPFGLEDWANSVAEANAGKLDRATARDIERLLAWVHKRLFHGH